MRFENSEREQFAESSMAIFTEEFKRLLMDIRPHKYDADSLTTVNLIDEVERGVAPIEHAPSFENQLLKSFLDETLLVLIAMRGSACGKELTADLQRLGYGVSPGTLYPHLHDLTDRGMLEVHELVRTKEFSIAKPTEMKDRIDDSIQQLIQLALLFATFTEHVEDV